jgi:hypothetical protein
MTFVPRRDEVKRTGKKYTVSSFIICALYIILLVWAENLSDMGGSGKCLQNIWFQNLQGDLVVDGRIILKSGYCRNRA